MKHLYRITFLIVLILIDLFLTNMISKSYFLYTNTEGTEFRNVDTANTLVVKSEGYFYSDRNLPTFLPYGLSRLAKCNYMIPQGKEAEIRKAALKNTSSNYNFQVQYLSKGMQFFDVRFYAHGSIYRTRYLVVDNKIYPIYYDSMRDPRFAKALSFPIASLITLGFWLVIALLIRLHDASMRKEKNIPAMQDGSPQRGDHTE